jgi:hypothetical protein
LSGGYIAFDDVGVPVYVSDLPRYLPTPAAIADGSEADAAHPIAAEPRVVLAEPDGHDLDVMGHAS